MTGAGAANPPPPRLCRHRICRFAQSDRLVLEAVRLHAAGKYGPSDRAALDARDVHQREVECKLVDQPLALQLPLDAA